MSLFGNKIRETANAFKRDRPKSFFKIGRFSLSPSKKGYIWIEHSSGEGGTFRADDLKEQIISTVPDDRYKTLAEAVEDLFKQIKVLKQQLTDTEVILWEANKKSRQRKDVLELVLLWFEAIESIREKLPHPFPTGLIEKIKKAVETL